MANKSSIQYPYAYSEHRELVHIDSVAKENRNEHSFICPCCGRKMLPRLGDINAHCFAHADNQKCGIESYIHKVAKLILAKRFNEKRSFIIGLLRSSNSCKNFESCPDYDKFLCYCPKDYHEYDLAKYYDLPAQIEVDIIEPDGITHYRPDLLLQSRGTDGGSEAMAFVYNKNKVQFTNLAGETPKLPISQLPPTTASNPRRVLQSLKPPGTGSLLGKERTFRISNNCRKEPMSMS